RADEWINKIIEWQNNGLKEVYYFPHQPENLLAPQMVEYFNGEFQKHSDVVVRGPKLDNKEGQQIQLFS
ncbi:MAG: DUF72 domain-containing protein, partial [Bacteroidota bacterium]